MGLRSAARPLPALTDPWEQQALHNPTLLRDIAIAVHGPFHVVNPQRMQANIRAFAAVTDGPIYFAKKANKAACFVRACAEADAGVDVSSVGELLSALAGGVRGTDLMVTGPAKHDELLWLASRHGALVAVDALDELDRITAPTRILLRVAASGSRFGLVEGELAAAVERVTGTRHIVLEGFSFHLSGYDPAARAELAAELVGRCVRAREFGHPADTISIGGGFAVDYVGAADWAQFNDNVEPAWFHQGHEFDSYYPYHCPAPGAAMLTAILDRIGNQLRNNRIQLAVEPGRALLDHCGFTVFPVLGSKTRSEHGEPYAIVTVAGTSLSLSEQWFDSEYLPDPVLWPAGPGDVTPTVVGASTCLESDMLSWRRIPLPRSAGPGDLLVYPNTAGYQMDSNESSFHELPLPPKIVLCPDNRWSLDRKESWLSSIV